MYWDLKCERHYTRARPGVVVKCLLRQTRTRLLHTDTDCLKMLYCLLLLCKTSKVPSSLGSSAQLGSSLRRPCTEPTCTVPNVNCTYGQQPPTEFISRLVSASVSCCTVPTCTVPIVTCTSRHLPPTTL